MSVLRTRLPSVTLIPPADFIARTSRSVKPPSGPISTKIFLSRAVLKTSRTVVSRSHSQQKSNSVFELSGEISASQSSSVRMLPIVGMVSRAHCSADSLAMRLQRSSLSFGRAIVLSEMSGSIPSTPSSVAFSMMLSKRFCLGRQSARMIFLPLMTC